MAGIASQLACYHGGSRSRRTYHAEHGTFYQDACGEVGQEYKEQCHQRETPALYQQQPQMPAAGAQVVQANLTEGKKQHREYQQRLNLGTWQGVYLCEFRNHGGARTVSVTLMGE